MQLNCYHQTCVDCFTAYIKTAFNQNQFAFFPPNGYTLSCPVYGCRGNVFYSLKWNPEALFRVSVHTPVFCLDSWFSVEDLILWCQVELPPGPNEWQVQRHQLFYLQKWVVGTFSTLKNLSSLIFQVQADLTGFGLKLLSGSAYQEARLVEKSPLWTVTEV